MKQKTRQSTGILRYISNRPIHFFLFVSALFGIIFIIAIPPFQNPDEFTHFTRAYEVSELKTAHRHHQGPVDIKGSELPKSILLTYNKTRLKHYLGSLDVPQAQKYYLNQTKTSLKIPLNKSVTSFYDTGSSPAYVPLVYVPQAIMIKALSLVNTPVVAMLYATRFVGLVTWIILVVLALYLMRPIKYRLALGGILLLPMFIAQAVNPSTDAMLTGLTVLYLILVARMVHEKDTLTVKKVALFVGILLLMVIAKPVYLAFGVLMFALRTKYGGLRDLAFKTAVIIIPFLIYGLWSILTKDNGGPLYVDAIGISHAVPSMQVGYLVPDIFKFFTPFINTIFLGWGDGVYVSLIGDFGKLDTPLPILFIILGYVFAAVSVFVGVNEHQDSESDYSQKRAMLLALLTALIFIVGVYLGMYIYSTPPHEKIVTGVQGRYLLPLLPLLALFITKHYLIMKEKLYSAIMISVPIIMLLASITVVVLRFYMQYP